MKQGKSISANFVFRLFYQLVALLVPLITTPYLTRTVGATALGDYGYIYSIATYASLLAVFGFNIYGRREIAKVRDDPEKLSQTFWEICFSRSVPSLIITLGYVILSICYRQYTLLLFCFLPFVLYNLLDITFLVQGEENFKFITLRDTLVKLVSIVLIFLLVKRPEDVWIYALIFTGSMFLSAACMLPYARKRISKPRFASLRIGYHLRKSVVFLVPALATAVFLYVDKIMIKLITTSSDEVAFYEEAIKIVTMLTGITTSLSNVIEPRNANEFALGHMDNVHKNVTKGLSLSLLICVPMAIGLMAVAPIFCPLFFGPGFEPVVLVLQILCIIIPFISINDFIGATYLIPIGKEKVYSMTILGCALLNVALNAVLIYFFHAIGAAIATLVSETVKGIILFAFAGKEFKWWGFIKGNVPKLIAGIVMGVFAFTISYFSSGGIVMLILIVGCGALLYLAALWLFKDREFLFLARYAGKILGRFIKHGKKQ